MFDGFTQETIDFFLNLQFNNYTSYFHEHKQTYIEKVRTPFYQLIDSLAPTMLQIDSEFEVRPYKCLSRIRRDTRFSKDKSPYRDHLWVLFKKQGKPREESLMFWFELSPRNVDWGMGFWGENKTALDLMRKNLLAKPKAFLDTINKAKLSQHQLVLTGVDYKRIKIPEELPTSLYQWYVKRRLYIQKTQPDYQMAFTKALIPTLEKDFLALKPLYTALQGIIKENE